VSRRIAHLDIDAFYASVELQRRPELRGLPVIVSGDGPRAVVTTASYEARRFGVGSAMPTAQARRLCPDAVLVPPDFEAYRAASRVVMGLVRATVDVVEVVGLDEAYLDLTGLFSPKAEMRRLVAEIRGATGLRASVGIGPNKLVAKIASDADKPAGFCVLTREQAVARFAGASPGLVPGIGPKTVERLTALGITTLAQLAATPDEILADRFGANQGPWLRRRGAFLDDAPVSEERIAVSESKERTFDVDVHEPDEMEEHLRRMSTELCAALGRQDRRARTIAIKIRLDDWTTVTRARTIPEYTAEADRVGAVAVELLRTYAPSRPVRLLGVRMASFAHEAAATADRGDQLALEL
jgi:DNA polymerase IV